MKRILLGLLPFALGAFFILGAVVNGTASPAVRQDFVTWGYPAWFPYVTAALELATAVLLFVRRSRILGAALGAAVMSAAAFTLITHGEYQHALPPIAVLALCLIVAGAAFKGGQGRHQAPKIARAPSNPWESDGA